MACHEWSYTGEKGPHMWHHAFPEAKGVRQSPIDIKPVALKTLQVGKKLTWKYIPENTEDITNTGYCWKVRINGKGSELFGGPLEDQFQLEQYHCHWGETNEEGSEHSVDGKKYAAEFHMVHWNVTKYPSFCEAAKHPDGLCVLGTFLTPGKKHPELAKIVCLLDKIEYRGQVAKINEPINPASFVPEGSSYYTYQGSLTTPPCSECVTWIVFKEPIEVSNEQLMAFRNLKSYLPQQTVPNDERQGFLKHNVRPTFPLGQREILECRQ